MFKMSAFSVDTGRQTGSQAHSSMAWLITDWSITSHHIETTDAGLDGLCIREISVYHPVRTIRRSDARAAGRRPRNKLVNAYPVCTFFRFRHCKNY